MSDSIQLLEDILNRGPSSETLCLVLEELKRLGHTTKVIQECLRALQFHPEDLALRLILAETYFEEGLLSQAEAEIETTTSQMGRYASAYWLQAKIYNAQKRNHEALHSLNTYLALRPQDERALDLLRGLETPEEVPPPKTPMDQAEAITLAGVEEPQPLIQEEIEIPPSAVEEEMSELSIEEDILSEIATPTLAEVYVHQGEILEALSIYKRVVAQNPEDQASLKRIEELIALQAGEPSPPLEEQGIPRAEEKNKKTLAILESWLANIRKMSEDTVSA
jgi:tetratricopeptide (TPR) repeat protein